MIVRTTLAILVALAAPFGAVAGEWKTYFQANDLSGWQIASGDASQWQAAGGVLRCKGEGHGWLATKDQYTDFEIQLDFRIPPGGNSGVHLRTPLAGNPTKSGMEIQILDDGAPIHKNILPYQHCGSLYGVQPASPRLGGNPGRWQHYDIVVRSRHVKVTYNGTVVVDTKLDDHASAAAEFPGMNNQRGHIGLQNHRTQVEFRNVRIRALE